MIQDRDAMSYLPEDVRIERAKAKARQIVAEEARRNAHAPMSPTLHGARNSARAASHRRKGA